MSTPANPLPPEGTYEPVALSECTVDDEIWYYPTGNIGSPCWIPIKGTRFVDSITMRSRVVVLRRIPPKPLIDDLHDVLCDLYACLPVGEKKDEIIRVLERYRREHKRESE